jgi:hypothetical protein
MRHATQRVDPEHAQELLQPVPRACISFSGDEGPEVHPVTLLWRDGRYLIGVSERSPALPGAGQEAVLLVDEGKQFFELRHHRSRYRRLDRAPAGAKPPCTWYELTPIRKAAWDFGALRMVSDDS